MNYLKLQQDILKDLHNMKGKYYFGGEDKLDLDGYEVDVVYIIDGYVGYAIPKEFWYIDEHKFPENKHINGKNVLKPAENSVPVSYAYTENSANGKGKLMLFKGENLNLYIDEKLLKYTDWSKDGRILKGSKDIAPLEIYSGQMLECIVLPVRVRKSE